jgi:hypothetical protein
LYNVMLWVLVTDVTVAVFCNYGREADIRCGCECLSRFPHSGHSHQVRASQASQWRLCRQSAIHDMGFNLTYALK